jgi:hypothetical protein
LVVVPVDDMLVPAACVVSLATARARLGLRVVVADLCAGSPAARLLGAADPGVHTVSLQGTQLLVIVPQRDEVIAVGPLDRRAGPARAPESVVTACSSADLLLTLATVDPSLGGEHLAGWARGAVAMVTAGHSSAARVHAVGEMVRLAGLSLIAGILVGADKSDESIGAALTAETDSDAVTDMNLRLDANGYFAAVHGARSGRQTDDS